MTAEPIDLSGFAGWVPFAALPNAEVPAGPGVYVVVRATDNPPTFLEVSPAGHFKGKDPTVPVAELAALWVPGTRIVYIGKASRGDGGRRGLRKRLDEFRRFGAGEPVGHSGGRRIWQLADHATLLVGWRVTDDAHAPRIESAMIAQFRAHYGAHPFANMRN
ncbi:hypothetical protein B1987_09155 [Mycobacterium kansasii]|uniref:GIY-YIG domain-containing protein n=1 Tax=Mycobacterium attenuatum TaxID=2341086 RepID=A0A498QA58_9MYCO|nr:hypothetical protein [Mycobacterium attenuatum]ORB83935.1 hypothetical protein B1987_09155 [Mycobacterium kansasii]VBA42237.1 hypothetical protein LAUMK136_04482 [Mycobacterium attenuatum]VBA58318.1 hypothetical protein LAUMK191_04477 [Mycobacterium attenuatum]VBA61232.1 hypothetical protein LAUMK41_04608 [Mycobacterium attenuatum]